MMAKSRPYGSWLSSLTAEKLAKKGVRFGHMCEDQGNLYWLESRANEKGRSVLLKCDLANGLSQPLPQDISVRSKVHEYGSGDFIVESNVVYFSHAGDQCLYRLDQNTPKKKLERLTQPNSNGEDRYADFCLSGDLKKLVCVRERHRKGRVINELISLELPISENTKTFHNCEVKVIHTGYDFYSFPRISKQGDQICWTCWNQPEMPWDAAELWVADFHDADQMDSAHKISGGRINSQESSSVYQPVWSDDGVLHYISDASGWSNVYSHRNEILNALAPIDREFGIPQWSLASSTFAIAPCGQIYALYVEEGNQLLCQIDSGKVTPIPLPFCYFGEHLICSDGSLYFRAAGPTQSEAVYRFELKNRALTRLSDENLFPLPNEELSVAQAIDFPSNNERIGHAFYYKPHNSRYQPTANTQPPLIVMSHGGPTGATTSSMNAAIQFWTHRGFAVVDVNYAGSTGYGNKYRNALKGNWGIADVEDCIAAAQHLVNKGKADKNALLIRGGSAGGYTTLCALTFHNVFTAGCSRYGVADLESLAADSHKFEARYLDSMIGAYPKKEKLYKARSPIHHAGQLSCPILLLQGKDDKVVPPNQAEMMVAALEKNKIPYAYRLYEGEGHGFRKAKTIIDALSSELSFYRQVLGIDDTVSESEVKLEIKNMKKFLLDR